MVVLEFPADCGLGVMVVVFIVLGRLLVCLVVCVGDLCCSLRWFGCLLLLFCCVGIGVMVARGCCLFGFVLGGFGGCLVFVHSGVWWLDCFYCAMLLGVLGGCVLLYWLAVGGCLLCVNSVVASLL